MRRFLLLLVVLLVGCGGGGAGSAPAGGQATDSSAPSDQGAAAATATAGASSAPDSRRVDGAICRSGRIHRGDPAGGRAEGLAAYLIEIEPLVSGFESGQRQAR